MTDPALPMTAALARLGRLMPSYRLLVGDPPSGARPTEDLLTDTQVLDDLVDALATRMAVGERRVAISTLVLGYAARLWSLALGTSHLTGACLDLDPLRLWWWSESGTIRLCSPEPRPGDSITVEVLDRQLTPLVAQAATGVARGLLWGNTASALLGTTHALPGTGPAVRDLLADPRLRGLLDPGTGRRRSCCLFYRAPTGGYCGDCPLTGSDPRAPTRDTRRPRRTPTQEKP